MNKMKKALGLILCLVLSLSSFVGCSGTNGSTVTTSGSGTAATSGTTAPEVKYAENLNVIIDNTKIAAINPIGSGGPGSATGWVYKMVYDSLITMDEDGNYLPNLALSWESTDWKTVTFKLRNDVKFSNGDPLTADDVVFTVEQALANPGSVAGATWTAVESAKAIDSTTVQLTLKKVYPQILFDASGQFACIMSKKAVTADPEKGVWVGTGAFTITAFASNDSVSLKRNDGFWGELPKTKTMTLRYIPEESTRLMMLQNGEADICFSLNAQDLPLVEADKEKYVTASYVSNNCMDIGFNMNDPICGDKNFRMAVASALNRSDIALGAVGANGIPETTGTFWGYVTPFRNKDIKIIPYNLDEAKKYLAASPYKGENIELVTSISTLIAASEVIQQQLSEIGINITIKQTDPASLMAYATYKDNKCQMYCFVGAFGFNPYSAYGVYYPGAAQNRASYNNPEITQLLDKVQVEADAAKQKELYFKIQELAAKDNPFINLFYMKQTVAALKGVEGFVLKSDVSHDLRNMYKVIG